MGERENRARLFAAGEAHAPRGAVRPHQHRLHGPPGLDARALPQRRLARARAPPSQAPPGAGVPAGAPAACNCHPGRHARACPNIGQGVAPAPAGC
jgi:hypothetical protein